MTISPRWGIWISLITALLMFVAGASTQLTDIFSADVAHKIVSVCILFGGAISAVNAVLHSIPSASTPQALAQFPLGPSKS